MNDSIAITLVRFHGRLVGKTVQDRWNLQMLGINALECDKNQNATRRVRNANKPVFTFNISRGSVDRLDWDDASYGDALALAPRMHFVLDWHDCFDQQMYMARAAA